MRVSKLRVAIAALVATGFVSLISVASASSISTSDVGLTSANAAPETANATTEPADSLLSLAGTSDAALDLVANVGLSGAQMQLALLEEEPATVAAAPAMPTFLSDAALPLALSDVPEPTAFGLLLLGLTGLFVMRRVAKKA